MIKNTISLIGKILISSTEGFGRQTLFFISTIKQVFKKPFFMDVFLQQLSKVGFDSLTVTFVTAIFTGAVYALSIGVTLEGRIQGTSQYLGPIVGLSMARELGPVLTALMITGRMGSSMAAELGTMRVTEQIDALVTLSTNPIKYLVVPRFLASIIMLPALTLIADLTGIIGGALVTKVFLNKNLIDYFGQIPAFVGMVDIMGGVIKGVIFGMIMAMVSCFQGFYTSGGAEGVGKATTRAVVITSMGVLVSDYFLTTVFTMFLWG